MAFYGKKSLHSVSQLTETVIFLSYTFPINQFNGYKMKQKFLLSVLTCGLLVGSTGLQAKTDAKVLMQKEMQKHAATSSEKASKEIVDGLQSTFTALGALQKNKKDTAEKLLKQATASFDKALKADPALGLVPIDEQIQAFEFTGSSKVIAARIKLTKQLLDAHDTQAAIDVLAPLKDELDIVTVSIPMDIYPVATKRAYEALKKGDTNTAVAELTTALGSLVTMKVVIPTPILAVQDIIVEASKLDKTKKAEAQKLLAAAKEEMKRAELLGYTSKHTALYKNISKDISQIKKEIKGKNEVYKLYDTLKHDLKNIIAKIHISRVKVLSQEEQNAKISNAGLHDSVGKEETKALKNPASVKDHTAAEAKVEETRDKDTFKAKEDVSAFSKEVKKDLGKVATPNEIKTINAEDKK